MGVVNTPAAGAKIGTYCKSIGSPKDLYFTGDKTWPFRYGKDRSDYLKIDKVKLDENYKVWFYLTFITSSLLSLPQKNRIFFRVEDGSGWGLEKEEIVLMSVENETQSLVFSKKESEDLIIPFSSLQNIEIFGPGEETSDAGFWGFGVKGIIAATAINTLTTMKTVTTRLRLSSAAEQIVFLTDTATPEELRDLFHAANSCIRDKETNSSSQSSDLTSQLESLLQLKDSGVLNEEEFAAAKAKLLS